VEGLCNWYWSGTKAPNGCIWVYSGGADTDKTSGRCVDKGGVACGVYGNAEQCEAEDAIAEGEGEGAGECFWNILNGVGTVLLYCLNFEF
jgi:hypothetical protein